mmetsp:Transcript_22725/g.19748  ORF Transcript_22725/g.19748 Transcript_22725/m.19748 type:complete len:91 (-) Transcript_22725:175-447(-)
MRKILILLAIVLSISMVYTQCCCDRKGESRGCHRRTELQDCIMNNCDYSSSINPPCKEACEAWRNGAEVPNTNDMKKPKPRVATAGAGRH